MRSNLIMYSFITSAPYRREVINVKASKNGITELRRLHVNKL